MENRNYDLRVNAVYEVPEIRPSGGVSRPSRFKALLLYLIVAASLLASSTIGSVLAMIFPNMGFWPMQTVTTFIFYLCGCLLPVFLFVRKKGREGVMQLRPNPLGFRTALLAVALAVLAIFFANNLNVLWALPFDAAGFDIYVSSAPTPENVGQLLLSILVVGVMPGMFEEMVFRGFMQPAFEEKGTRRAVIFVSLLFALLHGSTIGFPVQFILGMIMAMLIIITDSIYTGIIFHTVYNSGLMILLYVQTQMGVESSAPGELLNSLGGAVGVFAAFFGTIQMAAAIFFILFAMYRRAKRRGMTIVKKQQMRLRGGEIALLCGGLGLSLLYYILDFLAMAGVLVQ